MTQIRSHVSAFLGVMAFAASSYAGGGDVILSGIPDMINHGAVGGIRAYTIGSHTCNIGGPTGDVTPNAGNIEWVNGGPPGLAMNAYRMHDGRLMQIGMSWVKTACCASNSANCGLPFCTGGSSTALGVGCRDTYFASWNSTQSRLGPRSVYNAYDGSWGAIPSGSFNAITRRLQVAEAEMSTTAYPNALYFLEGVYVSRNDALNKNWLNNASYQRVTMSSFNFSLAGTFNSQVPGIYAWRDHGNGAGVPDNTVQYINIDVPDEGRFILASKVRDNGNGTWRYDYAIFNINSHRSGASLSIEAPQNINISSLGFHSPPYHSGEPYDNTVWSQTRRANDVFWASPQTFAQNQNTNALRWGTMYNFWFTSDRPPTYVRGVLNLFRPGTPDSVEFMTQGPEPAPQPTCPADIAPPKGDNTVGVPDLLAVISAWGPCGATPECPADIAPPGGDDTVGVPDLLAVIAAWGPCQQ